MFKKIIMLFAVSVMIAACGGGNDEEKTIKVKALQKNDKNLSCREILLEMNEAQFYNRMAHKNRGVKLKSMLMPLGYISTYMDSEDAINAAQARVEYLDRIYEIMHCEAREKEEEKLPLYKPMNENPAYSPTQEKPVYQQQPMNQRPVYPQSERIIEKSPEQQPVAEEPAVEKPVSGGQDGSRERFLNGSSLKYYLEKEGAGHNQ